MSKYGYLEVFQRVPSTFEITRVDCNMQLGFGYDWKFRYPKVNNGYLKMKYGYLNGNIK